MKTFYTITLFFVLLLSVTGVFAQQTEGEQGIELYKKGDYQKAADILLKAAGDDHDLWLFAGMAFARTDKKEEARHAFKKAAKSPPKPRRTTKRK